MNHSEIDRFLDALAAALGAPLDNIDIQALLDVARDAAHGVERPAAPLATFLVGYAAGLRRAAGDDIGAECASASALAERWSAS